MDLTISRRSGREEMESSNNGSGEAMTAPAEPSFLICPGGAFGTYREKGQSRNNTSGLPASSSKQSHRVVLFDAPEVKPKPQQRPGKLKSPETAKTGHDQGKSSSLTSPFNQPPHQGRVSHLNDRSVSLLPSNQQMIVSPIQKPTHELESTAEVSHNCATSTTNNSHQDHHHHQRHCIPALGSKESTEQKDSSSSRDTPPPPVAEIRIPTPQTHTAKTDDEVSCEEGEAGGGDEDENNDNDTDYKTLFFSCQHSLHKAQRQAAQVAEENRLLKRQLIQLQKQLNAYRRNKHPSSWTIPVNARLKTKRLRTEGD